MSLLSNVTCQKLQDNGFHFAGFGTATAHEIQAAKLAERKPRRPERWLCQARLPHVLITIGPDDPHDVTQIVHAVFQAGALEARAEIREQFKRLLQSCGLPPTDANLPPFLLDPEGAPLIEPPSETENREP